MPTGKSSPRSSQVALQQNVIDMALGFTATLRVFEPGSKATIAALLIDHFRQLDTAVSQEAFELVHKSFCSQFTSKVRVAKKPFKNGSSKPSAAASYGHAAKMFDVCAKVWFHYCHMPNSQVAGRITPYLHAAIDTPILKRLKSLPERTVSATTIAGIDEPTYRELQTLAARDRTNNFAAATTMVEYDDLIWSQLSREDASQVDHPK